MMSTFRKVGLILLALPIAVIAMETFGKGVSWTEMDWNSDGRTSIGEFFDTIDYGTYREIINGTECRHVYYAKDGSTVKELCP
jgi:hypothetical protein